MAGSPGRDLAGYQDPDVAVVYRRALDEGFVRGPAGYARDTTLAMGRWPFALGEISVLVDIWYGARDTGHSPDNGALLAPVCPVLITVSCRESAARCCGHMLRRSSPRLVRNSPPTGNPPADATWTRGPNQL